MEIKEGDKFSIRWNYAHDFVQRVKVLEIKRGKGIRLYSYFNKSYKWFTKEKIENQLKELKRKKV